MCTTLEKDFIVYIKGRYIVSACALLFFQHALATGMDCTKAANAVENTICANKGLYELDTQMGSVYRTLMNAASPAQVELKRSQRQWLKVRNECVEDVACLDQHYRERLLALHVQWVDVVAYQPDDVDKQVMEDLQQRIQDLSKDNPEFALERALDSMAFDSSTTSFPGDSGEDEQSLFPKAIPRDVTEDEWRALKASDIGDAAESGQTSYTLMDMDGDGQRDLIVETYSGGTGMFSYTQTYRRSEGRFISRTSGPAHESGPLFYTNERGANQSVNWIKARGKIYLAYRNGSYGVDQVFLLNPLKINNKVPTLTVRYGYQLTVPHTQHLEDGTTTFELEPALQKALAKALIKVNANEALETGRQKAPICPIPLSVQDSDDYYSFGASYYAIEPVADMPVVIGNECFIARLINWYGSYSDKDGLFALLTLRKPGSEDQERSYSINGRRHITQVSTSIGKAEGGAENF
ncbi:hypothetical protein CNN82_23280 [Pseudomonas frederiksbergensis]|uniref:Lysozyme inhibitor LprI-like N-terminal domain-containing protein n=1 Tax=Pseudomonas frederiksbergensis TaxID=104087 RepID=A0AB33EFU5_9PSED|nr:hypothetical protein CNN82_23280 [Pseudomonas frederiksbergensis]